MSDNYRVNPPLNTHKLDMAWINYEANKSLCEMFPEEKKPVLKWKREAAKSLDYITSHAAPFVVSLRVGGCSYSAMPEILSIPDKAIGAIKDSDYFLAAIERWLIRIGIAKFAKMVSDENTTTSMWLIGYFDLSDDDAMRLLEKVYALGIE